MFSWPFVDGDFSALAFAIALEMMPPVLPWKMDVSVSSPSVEVRYAECR